MRRVVLVWKLDAMIGSQKSRMRITHRRTGRPGVLHVHLIARKTFVLCSVFDL